MHDFRVIVPPISKYDDRLNTWQVPIYIERGIGNKEVFATVYGETKDIANLRAALVADAINKGMGQ